MTRTEEINADMYFLNLEEESQRLNSWREFDICQGRT